MTKSGFTKLATIMGTGIFLLLVLIVAAYASIYFFAPVGDYNFDVQNQSFAKQKAALLIHIGAGIIALIAGCLQILPYLHVKMRRYHRIIGVIYAASVMISAPAGLILAQNAYGYPPNIISFSILAILWIFTTSLGVMYAVKGRTEKHRIWMHRSYALACAGISLRLELGLYLGVFNMSFIDAYCLAGWTCWVFNLIIVEWIVLRPRALKRPNAHSSHYQVS